MAEQSKPMRRYNVEATYADSESARRAAEAAEAEGAEVTLDLPQDKQAVLYAQMRDEAESMVMGPGSVGPFTKSMTKGLLSGALIGGVIGLAAGLIVGLIAWPSTAGIIWSMVIGTAAGMTAGFTAGGFVKPRLDHEGELDAAAGPTVSAHTDDLQIARAAAARLAEKGPIRVDDVDLAGGPRQPSPESRKPVRGS
jgi:hypothetical protein